jgi:hypothetical protein
MSFSKDYYTQSRQSHFGDKEFQSAEDFYELYNLAFKSGIDKFKQLKWTTA